MTACEPAPADGNAACCAVTTKAKLGVWVLAMVADEPPLEDLTATVESEIQREMLEDAAVEPMRAAVDEAAMAPKPPLADKEDKMVTEMAPVVWKLVRVTELRTRSSKLSAWVKDPRPAVAIVVPDEAVTTICDRRPASPTKAEMPEVTRPATIAESDTHMVAALGEPPTEALDEAAEPEMPRPILVPITVTCKPEVVGMLDRGET